LAGSAPEKKDNNVSVHFPYFDPEISLDFSQTSSVSVLEEPEMDFALIMKALGDTTRFAIASLTAKTPLSSVEIAKSLEISKPTVSHHISILSGAGLIEDTHFNGRTRIQLCRKPSKHLRRSQLQDSTIIKAHRKNMSPRFWSYASIQKPNDEPTVLIEKKRCCCEATDNLNQGNGFTQLFANKGDDWYSNHASQGKR
jgi:DNA-binding transcriptional ArsR family regulator